MKTCPICNQPIKTDDLVVVLLLAKYKQIDDKKYDIGVMGQTIVSHLYCAETPREIKS